MTAVNKGSDAARPPAPVRPTADAAPVVVRWLENQYVRVCCTLPLRAQTALSIREDLLPEEAQVGIAAYVQS